MLQKQIKHFKKNLTTLIFRHSKWPVMGVEEVYVWTVPLGGARGLTWHPWHYLRHQVVEQVADNHKELFYRQQGDQEGPLDQAWALHLSKFNICFRLAETLFW